MAVLALWLLSEVAEDMSSSEAPRGGASSPSTRPCLPLAATRGRHSAEGVPQSPASAQRQLPYQMLLPDWPVSGDAVILIIISASYAQQRIPFLLFQQTCCLQK